VARNDLDIIGGLIELNAKIKYLRLNIQKQHGRAIVLIDVLALILALAISFIFLRL